jgi:catechol 2,3-dioxygenase-like lactoylglutathione lyase family enzyme
VITGLHHIAVAVRDLDAASQSYSRLFDVAPMAQDGGGARRAWFWLDNIGLEVIASDGAGPSGDRVRAQLDAAGEGQWLVAFTASDLDADARLFERRGLAVSERTERAVMFEPAATGGLQLALMGFPPLASRVKGPLTGLDHIVVGTSAPDRALGIYGAKLGLDLRLDRENAGWGARQMFFRAGEGLVEIGASLKEPASEKPDRFGGLAWRTTDPHATHARLAAAGFNVSELRAGRKPGTKVFTVRDAPGGVPTLIIQQNAEDA